jgi:hypothetical protein
LTSSNPLVSERQRIERIAEEYRSKGYNVLIEPSGPDLPQFLGDQHPDLIALRGDERLVIELKSPPSKAEPERIRGLAERVEKEPGWKFVLISPGPAEGIFPGEQLPLLSAPEVEQHLRYASRLVGSGHQEAALLLAWAAIEGQLRALAQQEEISLPRPDTPTLLRQLVSLGLVDREQHRRLTEAYKARSTVAHGFRPQTELDPAIHALIELSKELEKPQLEP